MLLKIYTTPKNCTQSDTPISVIEYMRYETEQLHLIENAEDVVVHQGNWNWEPFTEHPAGWGPLPREISNVDNFEAISGECVRVIDYTKDGARKRALIKKLCYVCNDQGKTIEKVEMYSGARLSV